MKNSKIFLLSILSVSFLNAAEKDNTLPTKADSAKSFSNRHLSEKRNTSSFKDLINQFRTFADNIESFSHDYNPFNYHYAAVSVNSNIIESDDQYKIIFELPGVEEKDIMLEFKNNTLVLNGHRRSVVKNERDDHYYKEDTANNFSQSLHFPPVIDENTIDAKLKNGILTIILKKDKTKIPASKKIKIHVDK